MPIGLATLKVVGLADGAPVTRMGDDHRIKVGQESLLKCPRKAPQDAALGPQEEVSPLRRAVSKGEQTTWQLCYGPDFSGKMGVGPGLQDLIIDSLGVS